MLERGMALFLNGEKIGVSATTSVEGSLLVIGFPYEEGELSRTVKI